MRLSVQLHLAGLLLSNIVSVLKIFDVQRTRSTAHNYVHKADLQPISGRSPTHIAIDETMIQLDDEQYWLYIAIDSEASGVLHIPPGPTTNSVLV